MRVRRLITTTQARFGGRFFQSVGEGDDMTEEQFTAFVVLLAAVSLPSVSLLFAGAWELWRYSAEVQRNNLREDTA